MALFFSFFFGFLEIVTLTRVSHVRCTGVVIVVVVVIVVIVIVVIAI